jgi:hypothetical protein
MNSMRVTTPLLKTDTPIFVEPSHRLTGGPSIQRRWEQRWEERWEEIRSVVVWISYRKPDLLYLTSLEKFTTLESTSPSRYVVGLLVLTEDKRE